MDKVRTKKYKAAAHISEKNRGAAASFTKCGMNPDDLEKEQYLSHLTSFSEDSVYFALIQNQDANDLALCS